METTEIIRRLKLFNSEWHEPVRREGLQEAIKLLESQANQVKEIGTIVTNA